MYLTVQGQEEADILQDDLNILQEWGKTWDIEFNQCSSTGAKPSHPITQQKPFYPVLTLLVYVLLTLSSIRFLFLKLSIVTVRHSQPARYHREGVLQNIKRKSI